MIVMAWFGALIYYGVAGNHWTTDIVDGDITQPRQATAPSSTSASQRHQMEMKPPGN